MDQQPDDSGDEFAIGIKIARDTMSGDIRDVILAEIQAGRDWASLLQAEQQRIIDRASLVGREVIGRVARILASDGKRTITAEVEKVDVKETKAGSVIKVTLNALRTHDNLVELGMAVGSTAMVAVPQLSPYLRERAPVHATPDQPAFDMGGRDEDGLTVNQGQPFELPPLAEDKLPEITVECLLGKRVRVSSAQFAAWSLAFAQPEEGEVEAEHLDEGDTARVTAVIFTAPETSDREGVSFNTLLLAEDGKATATVMITVRYVEAVAAAASMDEPGPELDPGTTAEGKPNGDAQPAAATSKTLKVPPATSGPRAGGRRRSAG